MKTIREHFESIKDDEVRLYMLNLCKYSLNPAYINSFRRVNTLLDALTHFFYWIFGDDNKDFINYLIGKIQNGETI